MPDDLSLVLQQLSIDDLGRQKAIDAVAEHSFEDLVCAVSGVIDHPVVGENAASSFVLHAPLELMARVGLHNAADMEATDRFAAWLGENGDGQHLSAALARIAVLRTGAAGHANIYTYLRR